MDKKVGLIGGISSRELVLELKKTSKEVYMVGGRREEGGHDIADCFLHVDISEKELIANWFKENGVVNIVIGTGHRLAIDLAEYLEERGMITSINVKASKLTKNKTEFKKFLNERGYITPKYVEFNTSDIDIEIRIQTEIGVPCVLKSPTDVKSPQKTSTISELKEKLHQYIEGLDVVLVEEFVNGVDCTIPLIANYDNVKAILFSYYNKSKECSLEGFNSATDVRRVSSHMEKLVMSQSEQIVKDALVLGASRVDYILKDNQYFVLEMNSVMQTGGVGTPYYEQFIRKEGVNFAELLIKNAFSIFTKRSK